MLLCIACVPDISEADAHISVVMQMVEKQIPPPISELKAATVPVQYLESKCSQLKIINNILYRTMNTNGELTDVVVLPQSLIPVVLKQLHDLGSHQSIKRTLKLVRLRRFNLPYYRNLVQVMRMS
jgi:hypothetical protein